LEVLMRPWVTAVGAEFDAVMREYDLPGAAIAVYQGGQEVLWRGSGDLRHREASIDVASVSKAATAVAMLVLVDEGRVDLESPVTRYWPEFGASGKEGVLVQHLLTHEAGVIGIRRPALPGDVWLHWDEMIGWIEKEPPWWGPGTAHGYHPYTFGHLVGEVVRRVSGRSLGTFFRERVAEPYGIDFHIGVPGEIQSRVVDLVRLPVRDGPWRDPDSLSQRLNNPVDAGTAYRNTPQWRAAEVPATNGHASAVGVARLAALLAGGGELDGKRLLSAELVEQAGQAQTSGLDVVSGDSSQYGLGFTVFGSGTFGSPGGFGSRLFADPYRRLGVGYVQNAGLPEENCFLPAERILQTINDG
jgi:CubicO group peptidase (beta-lactamase class C family)